MADQADVFAQLWPNQVYVEGTTGMILTPLGDPTLDVWTVELVDTQDINNPIVLAEATLTVDSRFSFLRSDPSTTELAQAGINEMRTETIAAFFNSPAVGQLVLYGTTKYVEVPPFVEGDPPVAFDGFGAMGITHDLATAIEEATDLSTAIIPGTTPPYPDSIKYSIQESLIIQASLTDYEINRSAQTDTATNQPVLAKDLDCFKQFDICVSAARSRKSGQIKNCKGPVVGQLVLCAPGALVCLGAAEICFVACGISVMTNMDYCISAAQDSFDAKTTQCNGDYNVCCSVNPCPDVE